MDVRQLHYFVTLAEQGSISSAAVTLQMAQPSLSENLMRMEKKLGVQLVVRSGRGIILTEAGQLLARHGRAIVDATAQAIGEIQHAGKQTRGPVAIGLPPSLGILLSVPLAETIQTEFPDVKLRISEGMSGDITEWIEDERIDFGYAYEIRDNQNIIFEPVLLEKLFLATAPDNRPDCIDFTNPDAPVIHGADLQSLPLALPASTHGARKIVERFARAAGISLNIVAEIDSLPQLITMAARASAFTILPHAAVLEEEASGKIQLFEITDPTMTRTAYLLRKRSRAITRANQAVQTSVRLIMHEMIDRFQLDAVVLDAQPTKKVSP
ncbi:LysR family transcriptional regulator [Hyphomonas sp. ND6WE1B]|uniref:LysR family transcriptional regulator n=1 Tax=Hyphomonas sp. ND6WE1B TaxID=1848191 RepID=UPI0008077111|nr:LysR family transcriptional regulator [Hyphomonas sp. ND6WE1B]